MKWLALALVLSCATAKPAPQDGELVVTAGDGRMLRSQELVGSTLAIGGRSVRIDAVTSETRDGRTVWLHRLHVIAADGTTSELCTADARGERWALIVAGDRGQREIVCSSGAVGKCIRWGYSPRVDRDVHAACVRMVRADYGGDGTTHTRDGTLIAFCDRIGIHPCEGDEPIEAAWTPEGASCVAYPRVPELVSLGQLAARYPRLVGHLGVACAMKREGAKLFDWRPR